MTVNSSQHREAGVGLFALRNGGLMLKPDPGSGGSKCKADLAVCINRMLVRLVRVGLASRLWGGYDTAMELWREAYLPYDLYLRSMLDGVRCQGCDKTYPASIELVRDSSEGATMVLDALSRDACSSIKTSKTLHNYQLASSLAPGRGTQRGPQCHIQIPMPDRSSPCL